MKECSICKTSKPLSDYRINERRKDQHDCYCRDCAITKYDDYAKNKQEILKEKRRVYRQNNKEAIKVSIRSWITRNRERYDEGLANYWKKTKKASNAKSKERLKENKRGCIKLLGGRCNHCDETEIEFLTLDHINNDGAKERKNMHHKTLYRLINTGVISPDNYQVLCYNCNCKKQILYMHNKKPESKYVVSEIKCNKCDNLMLFTWAKHRKYGKRKKHICYYCVKEKYRKMKNQVLGIYDNKCNCCNESDPDKLTIDHVNNDGNLHRQTHGTGVELYRRIISGEIDRTQFQILCWGCNFSKHLGKGVCVHNRCGEM